MIKRFSLYSFLFILFTLNLFSQTTNNLQTTGNVKSTGAVVGALELNSPFPNAALPDSTLFNWDTSMAGTPTLVGSGGKIICVGTLTNTALLPVPCDVSHSFPTASYAALSSALVSANCGDWVVAQNTQYANATVSLLLPNNKVCPAGQYIYVMRDITDTVFPLEGYRVDECSIGMNQSVMPWHRYPAWDTTPNNCPTRHMPQIITTGRVLGGGTSFAFPQNSNLPSIGSFRFIGWEIYNNDDEDIHFAILDLSYNPPIDCALNSAINTITLAASGTGYTVGDVLTVTGGGSSANVIVTAVTTLGAILNTGGIKLNAPGSGYTVSSGVALTGGTGTGGQINITALNGGNALLIHPDFCQTDQPVRVICDRCILHCSAQRQCAAGVKTGGASFFALLDSDVYNVGETYAGGGGDATSISTGVGHGYTGYGKIKIANNYLSASTENAMIAGGAFNEPFYTLTGADGNVRNIWLFQNWADKNIMWNPQRGQSGNRTINVDGNTLPPINAMELVVSPHTLELQVGQTYEIHYTLFNYTGQGLDRDVNTVVVDGVTNGNSTTGTITKNGEHNIGSGKWTATNMVTYTYTAPSTPTAPGSPHIVQLNSVVQDTSLTNLGHNLTLFDSLAITVVSGTATKQMTLHPKLPDLTIQPSYSDNNFNVQQFCILLVNAPNYTPVSFTYTVDSIPNGNGLVGTIDTTGPAYCSGTQTGTHTITSTSAGGTSDSIIVNVSTTAAIADFDLKAHVSKNMIEFKVGCQILIQYNYFENAWGGQGNGGGQSGETFIDQVINQNFQYIDGTGAVVGWGPQKQCDVNYDHNYFKGSGIGFVLYTNNGAGSGFNLGMHRVTISNNIFDDSSAKHNSNGWLTQTAMAGIGGTASTTVLGWTSLTNPLLDNVVVNHNDFLGDASNTFNINQNTAQFPIGPLTIKNNIISSPTSFPFINEFGDANDCDRAVNTVTGNTLSKALLGTFYTPAKPCSQALYFDYNLFLDSTACTGPGTPVASCTGDAFLPSTHIYYSPSTATDLFANANGLNGGDYHICKGVGIPAASCTGNTYSASGIKPGDDGVAMGADVDGVMAAVTNAVLGIRTPPGVIVPVTTLSAETSNNSSACSSATTPSYCNIALPDFKTKTINTGAQTVHLTPLGHISQMPLSTYLYPGATTRWIAAYQPWFNPSFCWSGSTPGSNHPCVGYNENTGSVVTAQHTLMLNEGFTDVSPDWYGNSGNSDSTFINNTVIAEAADLLARCSGTCPLHLMIMVDGGLIVNGMSGVSGCPRTSVDSTTCITTVLNAAFDYINTNWGTKSYYSTDPVSGNPMALTFITKGDWSGSNWATIWTNVKTHMGGYAKPYKVIEEYGSFTDTAIDGAYGWPQSESYSSTNQFCWQGGSCSFDYFNNLYINARANPSQIVIGQMWPGFDGSNNTYNNDVTARQCGQLLYLQSQKPWSTGTGFTLYSSSSQLPWMIVPTWNDYGEGTNVENGVDNCYTISSSLSSNILSWSLTPTDGTYATLNTVDHFTIWYADGLGNLYKAADNLSNSTTSLNISTLVPIGSFTMYVEMVGKPLIINRMSNGVLYTH